MYRYELSDLIYQNDSDTCRIYNCKNDNKKVIKVINRTSLETDKRLIKLTRNHRNIRKIYSIQNHHDNLYVNYIIMEKLEGWDLFDCVINECLPDGTKFNMKIIMYILKGVLSGLSYLHQNGVIHADIKLENIFITNNYGVKIIDFGGSKWEGHNSKCGGSLPYVAPEIMGGDKDVNPKMDIWSLGITLYILIEGKYPFIENVDDFIKNMILLKEAIYELMFYHYSLEEMTDMDSPLWNSSLKYLIKNMLETDVRKRFSSEQLLYKVNKFYDKL